MTMGCDPCGAAGRLTRSGGTAFTKDEEECIEQAREQLRADGVPRPDKAQLVAQLHRMCKFGRSCTCFHGRFWEQDADHADVPAYLDALPKDDPRRLEYEAHIRRSIP